MSVQGKVNYFGVSCQMFQCMQFIKVKLVISEKDIWNQYNHTPLFIALPSKYMDNVRMDVSS